MVFGTKKVGNFSQIKGEGRKGNVASYWAVSVPFMVLLGVVLVLRFSRGRVELRNGNIFFSSTWFYMLGYCVGRDCVATLTGLGTRTGLGGL